MKLMAPSHVVFMDNLGSIFVRQSISDKMDHTVCRKHWESSSEIVGEWYGVESHLL